MTDLNEGLRRVQLIKMGKKVTSLLLMISSAEENITQRIISCNITCGRTITFPALWVFFLMYPSLENK